MTRAAALIIVLLMSAAAQALQDVPSPIALADMGLAGMQVLSDSQASAIRGRGFEPGSHLAGFESYQASKAKFKEHVARFRERIKHQKFAGAEGFKKSKENFRKHVKKFRNAVCKIQRKIH